MSCPGASEHSFFRDLGPQHNTHAPSTWRGRTTRGFAAAGNRHDSPRRLSRLDSLRDTFRASARAAIRTTFSCCLLLSANVLRLPRAASQAVPSGSMHVTLSKRSIPGMLHVRGMHVTSCVDRTALRQKHSVRSYREPAADDDARFSITPFFRYMYQVPYTISKQAALNILELNSSAGYYCCDTYVKPVLKPRFPRCRVQSSLAKQRSRLFGTTGSGSGEEQQRGTRTAYHRRGKRERQHSRGHRSTQRDVCMIYDIPIDTR